jgi:hypothetical protein
MGARSTVEERLHEEGAEQDDDDQGDDDVLHSDPQMV